jgi:hypothetical protein
MKTMLIVALTGVILGVVVASLFVPAALSWYAEPGGLPKGAQIQAVVQIPEVIRYATGKLILGQMIGGGIGGVLGLVGGYMMGKKSPADNARLASAKV